MSEKPTQQVFVLMEWHGRIVTRRGFVTTFVQSGGRR